MQVANVGSAVMKHGLNNYVGSLTIESNEQGSHYILVLKFKYFSRTLKLHFQGPVQDGSLQHGQYYSNI